MSGSIERIRWGELPQQLLPGSHTALRACKRRPERGAMSGHSLKRDERLRLQAEFRRVFQQGSRVSDEHLVLYACFNDAGRCRLGLSVAKRLGNAVKRNRLKRRLREAFRLAKDQLPVDLDIVLVPRRAELPELTRLIRSVVKLAHAARRRLIRQSAGDRPRQHRS